MPEPIDPNRTVDEVPSRDPLDAGLAAAFGPDSGSVLRALGGRPVLLREPATEPPVPVERPDSPEAPAADPTARLQVHGEIARGGMGAVLKGRDTELGREVAVKVLLEAHAGRTELVQRFVEEAQIAGQLQHPGVVPVYDFGQLPDRRPYFTMKLVKGQTLAKQLAERTDPAQDRPRFLGVFLQVCQALAYAHARGVIHRDLKPSNVMVGTFGEVQVMDWGLAKVLAEGGAADERQTPEATVIRTARSGPGTPAGSGSQTAAGQVLGTPAYMAPEQARGEADRLDERCDVFGLGAILCQVLTGQPPYIGEDASEVYARAARGELSDAFGRLGASGADPELIDLAKRCLAAERKARPRDAAALVAALTAYLEGVETRLRNAELERAEAQVRVREERKRRRVQFALAAAVVALFALGGGGWVWQAQARAARVARTTSAVNDALGEAIALREQARVAPVHDAAPWTATADAIRRAEGLLAEGEADEELRRKLRELSDDFADEQRERRLLDTLEDIRLRRIDFDSDKGVARRTPGGNARPGPDTYAAALREYGLDLDHADPAAVGRMFRSDATRQQVAAVLAEFAEENPRAPEAGAVSPQAGQLLALADALDPDTWRGRLRAAMAKHDVAALKEMAAEPEAVALPALTVSNLALALMVGKAAPDAVVLLRKAQLRHPDDWWINFDLGYCIFQTDRRKWQSAVRYYQAALALRPHSGVIHSFIGAAIGANDPEESAASYRRAIELNDKEPGFHGGLAHALKAKSDFAGALDAFRSASNLEPRNPRPHADIGDILHERGERDEAIKEYRIALALGIKGLEGAAVHQHLAISLRDKGEHGEALAHFKEAVELEPKSAVMWNSLGAAYTDAKETEKAIEAYAKARSLDEKDEVSRFNLGCELIDAGRFDESVPPLREAVRLKPGHAEAYRKLSVALFYSGSAAEALEAYRTGAARAAGDPTWRKPSPEWERRLSQMADLERRLPKILSGESSVAKDEQLLLAQLCSYKQLSATAARNYEVAFADRPELLEETASTRFNAACALVRAGCGQGKDAASSGVKERTRWRKLALDWLRADLAARAHQLDGAKPAEREGLLNFLRQWRQDPDLTSVRDEAALAKLSADERAGWQKFWTEVDALLKKAQQR